MRMAKDIGVTPSQLHELVSKGPGATNLLKTMLVALHVDSKVLADMDPLVMRELQWLCITCNNKKRCERELANGTATEHFREFCRGRETPMPCRSMSYSIKRGNLTHIKERDARIGAAHRMSTFGS